jgi:carotenoid cleavage dioxygenase
MGGGHLSRRELLRRGAIGAFGLSSAGAFLAACGDGGGGGSSAASPATTTGPPSTITPHGAPDAPWWLRGNFAPVREEIETTDLTVTGEIPAALAGLYVRNGSNPVPETSPHWFLGDGMLHGVLLEDGNAQWYRNRYVRTALYEAGGGLTASGAPGGASSLSNVSVVYHGAKLLSLGEVGLPYEIEPADLSTVGPYDFAGGLTGNVTAHPKIDPATGRMHFFGYGFTPPFLMYYVAESDGTLITAEPIEVGASTMIHDFAITDSDVIFWEFPVLFDLDLAVEMVSTPNSTVMPYVWTPEYGARIGVMPLGGPTRAIRWVEIEPGYVFHGVNAFRSGPDEIVVDVCHQEKVFYGDGLGTPSQHHRWHLLTGGDSLSFSSEVVSDRPADLPSIDKRFAGRVHEHSWKVVTGTDPNNVELRGVVHHQVTNGTEQVYDPGPTRSSGEWLFVPEGDDEADGYLLTYVYDAADDSCALEILRALDVESGPVASVALPKRVPYGFHATWVPA